MTKKTFVALVLVSLFLSKESSAHEAESAAKSAQTPMPQQSAGVDKSYWKTFVDIKDGNRRFMRGRMEHQKQDITARMALASGQKPHTIVLSCSDSRVPPELIFDQGLGELFVVRVAGEVPDANAVASIEYAIEHLGAKHLLVMGHESCGAVKAALNTPVGSSAGSKDLDHLVADIRPNVEEFFTRKPAADDKKLRAPVIANVKGVVGSLIRRSKIVQEAVEQKKLLVSQGIYSLETGEVEFWEVGHPGAHIE